MIRVCDDYAIMADTNCYSAAKRSVAGNGAKNAGQEIWTQFAHFSTLHGAVCAIVRQLQREAVRSKDMSLNEAVEALRSVEQQVHEWISAEVSI